MKKLRVIVMGLVVAVAALLAVGYALRKPLALRLAEGVIQRNMSTNLVDELPDGLHLALCGAGSPLPDPDRSGPCAAVIAGKHVYVVDAGAGASRTLARMRIPQGRIAAILLTHFHSDHIDGLGELMMQRWVNGGHTEPVPVHGPGGVETVVYGFKWAYSQDVVYRVAHHGHDTVPRTGSSGVASAFDLPTQGNDVVVLDRDGLRVTAFRVDHSPIDPAVGYRFDYAGRSLALSGDTVKSANLERAANGVDLLVHEALSPKLVGLITAAARAEGRANLAKITLDILDYHTSPVEAAQSASAANARHLLYYHIVPPLPIAPLEDVFLEGVDAAYAGPVTLGRDGTLVSLPAGSDAIEVRDLL